MTLLKAEDYKGDYMSLGMVRGINLFGTIGIVLFILFILLVTIGFNAQTTTCIQSTIKLQVNV